MHSLLRTVFSTPTKSKIAYFGLDAGVDVLKKETNSCRTYTTHHHPSGQRIQVALEHSLKAVLLLNPHH